MVTLAFEWRNFKALRTSALALMLAGCSERTRYLAAYWKSRAIGQLLGYS